MGVEGRPPVTLGDVLTEHRRRRFVGRSAEIELFVTALGDADDPPFSVLHIHGPGGVGKTSLLEALDAIARDAGATVARLDGRDVEPSPTSVLGALEDTLAVPEGDGPIGLPEGGRLVLLVDAYEQMAPLDHWLRSRLLPRLPDTALTVIASRNPPTPAWRADPAWASLLRVVSLRNLSPDDSETYLCRAGIDPQLHERILRLTYGHPLGLALLTQVVAGGGQVVEGDVLPLDLVEVLLPRFVERVPDLRHRRGLVACAVARCTNEALLRHVLEESDVRDLFTWLEGLSFVEPRQDGLAPHDLARDVLIADLRWRDLATYEHVFHKVREHSLAALRATTGRAQQRAIFDLKFLFRHARSAMAPVEWGSWGEYYPEPVRPEDHRAILELVEAWEGEESACIAARWLDRQPEAFSVIRDVEDSVQGMLAIVDLTRSSPEDRDADPGARAAWDFAHRHAPPRPGEVLTLCRFVVDRHSYQGPSATLNATPILTLQKELSTPNLSWDFLALAEPDRWNEYFAAAGLPRAAGADFRVGDHRYGLFAHDFRRVPVDVLTQRWTELSVAEDVRASSRDQPREFLVLSHPDFEAAVRQGFKDLRRPDLLARNPLLRTRLVTDRMREPASGAAVLEAVLRDAAMTLARHPRDDRLLRAVDRTYLRPAATQEAAAAALGLPFSTYRRHLTQGMTRILSTLWDQELYGQNRAEVST